MTLVNVCRFSVALLCFALAPLSCRHLAAEVGPDQPGAPANPGYATAFYTVLVASPRVQLILEKPLSECGRGVDGCTRITGARLRAQCEQRDELWRIHADVSFIPFVYIVHHGHRTRREVIEHEMTHIRDFADDAADYARVLTSLSFPSERQRRMTALEEEAVFHSRMQYYRQRTADARN